MHKPPDNDQSSPDSSSDVPDPSGVEVRGRRSRRQRRVDDRPTASSPSATGPAGALLEGHVGAQYLLPLLTGGEARGLPGVVVTRVAFQRGALGHPMDDVIITGVDAQGRPATLEVQAKRSLTFTSSDAAFADVVALACQATATPTFQAAHHQLAVAIARTSTKIEQYVQVVLKWARDYQDATTFFARLNLQGGAHHEMRAFVGATRSNMQKARAEHDDKSVWRLLSRFQVLAFDLESPGSICMAWARERCATALVATNADRAGDLWDSLAQIAIEVDAVGGDLDSPALRARLEERGYRLAGDRRFHQARDRLAETSSHALGAIKSTVHGVHVDRTFTVEGALQALEKGRYLEIRGTGGVGKSGVLREIANWLGAESRVIVLAPNRVPSGGWAALRSQLGCEATAREFLADLAGDGGGILFIDGIDRFDDPGQRNTVADLLSEVAQVPGFRVVATARIDFDADARAWIPAQALQTFGEAPSLIIDELSDNEVAQLRQSDPTLASLLRLGHPAEKLVRNMYRLDRLSRSAPSDTSVLSEAQMAKQWWDTGDGASLPGRLDRQRVLRALATHLLVSSVPMDSSGLPAEAITGLIACGSLRHITAVRTQAMDDVLGDWAIGCLLFDEPERVATLPLSSPAPVRLARGLEIAARLHAEIQPDAHAWRTLLDQVSVASAHGSWRRLALLALVRSERCGDALDRCLPNLKSEYDAPLLAEIVGTSIVIDSQAAAPFWAAAGVDASRFTDDFALPLGPAWLNLIKWSLANVERLPELSVPQWVDLYGRWCNANLGQDTLSPLLELQLYDWLVAADASSDLRRLPFAATADEAPQLSLSKSQRGDLRRTFLAWCQLCPEETASYVSALARHPYRDEGFEELLTFVGTAPNAAPQALADLFLRVLPEGDDEDGNRSVGDLFSHWDLNYLPASPARPPFLALLQANKEQGLRLVRGLITHAVSRRSGGRASGDDQIAVPLLEGARNFPWEQSYMMSRTDNSYVVMSALMALEAWAHLRVDAGEPVQDVIQDVLGPEGSPAAYLLVAIDVLLSHWPQSQESIWPFAASPELLVHDRLRLAQEQLGHMSQPWVHPEPSGPVLLADLQRRVSRRISLERVFVNFAHDGPESIRKTMRIALQAAEARLGAPDDNDGLNDPSVMATHALNRLDPANYRALGNPPGSKGFEYVAPAEEASRFARLQRRDAPKYAQTILVSQLTQVVRDPVSSEPLLEQGVAWATRTATADEEPTDDVEREMVERAKLVVAALVFRDGSTEMQVAHGAWAAGQLAVAASNDTDEDRPRQLPYNVSAIAAIGLLAEQRNAPQTANLSHLFWLAAQPSTNIVEVVRLDLKAGRPLSDDLKRSLVRLALTASIYTLRQRVDLDGVTDYQAHHNEQEADRKHADRDQRQAAVDAELAWFTGQSPEPHWPDLPPPDEPRPRHRVRTGAATIAPAAPAPRRFLALDDSKAADVVELAVELWRVTNPELLSDLVQHTWPWTAAANGVGAGDDYEPGERAFEWNHAYFPAALAAGVALGPEHIQTYLVDPMAQLPEERFLMAAGATLRALDQLWLGDHAIADQAAVATRETIVQRIRTTWCWRRLTGKPSTGIATDAAEAVAAMFMNNYLLGGKLNCYVLPPGMDRVDNCLPFLANVAEQAGGSTFVALAILSLLEVEPRPSRLAVLSGLVTAWWVIYGANAEFWVNYGIAKRVCDWIDTGVLSAGAARDVLESAELTLVIDVILKCGGPMARALEERVTERRAEVL